jgi:hypothetical protein
LRGRVREGGSFGSRRHDRLQNAIPIAQDIGIPEAENPVALRGEPSITFNVTRILRVLAAIDFDEASDRHLSAKTQSA